MRTAMPGLYEGWSDLARPAADVRESDLQEPGRGFSGYRAIEMPLTTSFRLPEVMAEATVRRHRATNNMVEALGH